MTVPAYWNGDWTAAVVNHLWQSTVVVGVAWVLAWALRKNHARVRYCVWFAASLKFLLPFSLLMAAGEWMRSQMATPVVVQPVVASVMEQMAQPFAGREFFDATPSVAVVHHGLLLAMNWWLVALLAVWACGALTVLRRFARGWWRVYSAKRDARALGRIVASGWFECDDTPGAETHPGSIRPMPGLKSRPTADVPVLLSSAKIEPGIFGIVRPVLLLPEGILERLTAEQMRAVVAHEMEHVRRRDNLTFAVHMVVEALFWFFPPVWWIGARLIEERERACDEAVVAAGGEAEAYAEGILNVCKFYVESPVACVAGVTGADLKKRIVRIMAVRMGRKVSLSGKMLLAGLSVFAVVLPVFAGWGQAPVRLIHSGDGVRYAFEVATIKPSPDTALPTWVMMSPAHFSVKDMSVGDMIKFAYGIKSDEQLVGAQSWLKTEHFDIQAKASAADIATFHKLDFDHRIAMSGLFLQALLQDRFQLKAQIETRELPVYALVVARDGIKMKEVQAELPPPGEQPGPPGPHLPMLRPTGPNQYTATAWPMNQLTDWLSHFYEVGNRPVVDETGLKGSYDWVLSGVAQRAPAPGDADGISAHEAPVSLFAALPEQLGLKLVPEKAPTEVLVIEKIEQPTAN